jgi:hypothetical protein
LWASSAPRKLMLHLLEKNLAKSYQNFHVEPLSRSSNMLTPIALYVELAHYLCEDAIPALVRFAYLLI